MWLDALTKGGLEVHVASGGRELQLCCPLCQDHKPRMYVNAQTGAFICFRCEERGGSYLLCRNVLELDHFQTMRTIERITQGSAEHGLGNSQANAATEQPEQGITMPEEIHLLDNPDSPIEQQFWRYLSGRGLTQHDVRTCRMGYSLRGLYAYRVIIPVYSEGTMWTFVARSIAGAEPKTLHPGGGKPSHALFNIDGVTSTTIFLVEGVFDAIRMGQNGVATLGTNLSPHQRDLLHRHKVEQVVLLWDGDEAGRRGAAKVASQLIASMFHVKLALLPEGEDPGSAPWDTVLEAVKKAVPLADPYVSERLNARRLDTPQHIL